MGDVLGIGGSGKNTDRKTELASWGDLSQLFGTGTQIGQEEQGAGESALNQSQQYFSSLLSNDPGKVAQAVAPAVNAITGQAEQQRKTTAEFGNRGGGTNAATQSITSNTSGEITNLINSILPQAASSLGNIGATREGLGLQGYNLAENSASTLGSLTEEARKTDIQQENLEGQGLANLLTGGSGGALSLLGV